MHARTPKRTIRGHLAPASRVHATLRQQPEQDRVRPKQIPCGRVYGAELQHGGLGMPDREQGIDDLPRPTLEITLHR